MTSASLLSTSPTKAVDEDVTARWHDAGGDTDLALRTHVALVLGLDPRCVSVGRLCGRCGSAEHGRPWASHGVQVSLARSGPHLVTAVSTTGRVGVDVQSVTEVDRAWDDLAALLDTGTVVRGTARAALWSRVEAVLKRDGTGFDSPRDLEEAAQDVVDDLVAPYGYCAAVSVEDC